MLEKFSIYTYLPEMASKHGAEIDFIIEIIHWLMLVLGVGWGLFFIYCLFRFHHKRNPKADYEGMKSHFSKYVEYAVVAFEGFLLLGLSIPFWAQEIDVVPEGDDVFPVRVVAEQFAWNIHYPGVDGKFGKTHVKYMNAETNPLGLDPNDPFGKDDIHTVNDLTLPVNKTILASVTSKDVIHSFALQEMRIKQDTIPGMEIKQSWVPIKTGKWEISCAQLCGLGHYSMRGDHVVLSQEEFDAWYAEKAKEAAEKAAGGDDDFW